MGASLRLVLTQSQTRGRQTPSSTGVRFTQACSLLGTRYTKPPLILLE